MKNILKLLLFTLGILVLAVALIAAGTIILGALDDYEQHRSALSEGEGSQ